MSETPGEADAAVRERPCGNHCFPRRHPQTTPSGPGGPATGSAATSPRASGLPPQRSSHQLGRQREPAPSGEPERIVSVCWSCAPPPPVQSSCPHPPSAGAPCAEALPAPAPSNRAFLVVLPFPPWILGTSVHTQHPFSLPPSAPCDMLSKPGWVVTRPAPVFYKSTKKPEMSVPG